MVTTYRIIRPGAAFLAALITAFILVPVASAQASTPVVVDQAALLFEINRARWNPAAFKARDAEITMPDDVQAAPPLASNGSLTSSATFKTNEMADYGYFGHQSAVTGIWPNKLARNHGFVLPAGYSDTANNIESLHGGSPDPFRVLRSFANSPSHRRHIFGEGDFFFGHTVVGIGRSSNQNYWAVHTAPTANRSVIGFVYDDTNGDGIMQTGEGLGGVTVKIGSSTTQTNAGGMYSMVVGSGSKTITFSGGGLSASKSTSFAVGSYNVNVDYVVGDTKPVVRAYQLCNGLRPTVLGTDGDDILYANPGVVDVIQGLGGNDTVIGATSNDILCFNGGSMTAGEGSTPVERLAGPTRYGTAVAVSVATNPNGASVVYLATGTNFPDALSAGPAAASANAPILLVDHSSIPTVTANEIKRLNPSSVVLLGGTDTITSGVVNQVKSLVPGASVSRLAGETRYETSIAISKARFSAGVGTVYIASGADFPDALISAAAAYASGGPLLLVRPDGIHAPLAAELARLAPNKIVIVGSSGVVSSQIEAQLGGYANTVKRIAASNRYATAVALSKYAFAGGSSVVYIAVGTNFPDALAGGAAAHHALGPVLLVQTNSVPQVVRDEIVRLNPDRIVILGGDAAVSYAVQAELAALSG
jgi:putative cell wall-binding protein